MSTKRRIGQKSLQRPLVERILVQWLCSVASEIKLWEEKEPKLTLESSSPGFSPTSICLLGSGSFSLLIIASTKREGKGNEGR